MPLIIDYVGDATLVYSRQNSCISPLVLKTNQKSKQEVWSRRSLVDSVLLY